MRGHNIYLEEGLVDLSVRKTKTRLMPVAIGSSKHAPADRIPYRERI